MNKEAIKPGRPLRPQKLSSISMQTPGLNPSELPALFPSLRACTAATRIRMLLAIGSTAKTTKRQKLNLQQFARLKLNPAEFPTARLGCPTIIQPCHKNTHSVEAISVFLWPESKMSSPGTDSTSKSLSSETGMENQLVLSESPEKDEENPFTVPPDIDIFSIRDKEIKKAKAERERMKTMKIHEKITYSSKIKAKPKELKKALQKEEKEESRNQATDEERSKTPEKILSSKAIKRDYPQVKMFHEYINNERDIFLLKYDMAVKQEEIQKLKKIIKNEERKLEKAENYLEKEATMFEEFLKENHKTYFQALKIAEKETAAKTKKISEVRLITSQIEKLQSDITRLKTTLEEYKMYRDFLYQLSPKEWQKENRKKRTKEKDLETASKADEEIASPPATAEQGQGLTDTTSPYGTSYTDVPSSLLSSRNLEFCSLHEIRPQLRNFLKPLSTGIISSLEDAESETSLDEDEEPKLYFTDPQQLLSVFMEMKDENLSLIQNAQEIEENLAKVQHTFITTHESTEEQLAELKQQMVTLKSSVAKEEQRVADLKLKVQLFSSAEHKVDDQDKMLTSLNEKVLKVYWDCTGKNETNLQTIQILMVIEKQLNDLLDSLERIPPAKRERVEKAKRKERMTRLREEKLRLQKEQQEERSQRALERSLARSLASTEKKSSRRLMFRSNPPVRKEKKKHKQEQIDKEKEEYLYYFT
ncbi:cilia- and flagella-associated protein 100 [Cuculus canorus]|uniref:cilia- and flagella-associated protein 100 n=1 Tax=Cuculus canorus TaxID=55661 RepID=UPI0023AB3C63|nr:cilia- and flagella-associated protein 100 [Cuculus canorus]